MSTADTLFPDNAVTRQHAWASATGTTPGNASRAAPMSSVANRGIRGLLPHTATGCFIAKVQFPLIDSSHVHVTLEQPKPGPGVVCCSEKRVVSALGRPAARFFLHTDTAQKLEQPLLTRSFDRNT